MTAEARAIVAAYRAKYAELERELNKIDAMRSHYDKDGARLTLFEFIALFDNEEYCRVALDEIAGVGTLSTVWLGIDHNFCGGAPLIFETMAFSVERDRVLNDWFQKALLQYRYSTLDDAIAGHAQILAHLRAHAQG